MMETGKRFIPPKVNLLKMKKHGIDASKMTSAQKKKLRGKLNDKRVDVITKMMEREPELFSFLWIRMSVESQEEIRAHDVKKFKIIFQNKDPVGLFALIRVVHSANPNGIGAAAFDRQQLRERYALFRQLVGQKIQDFRVLYDNWQVTLRVGGIPVLADDEIAADFISKLDPVRYAQFLTELLNQASRDGGLPMPQTLASAFDAARKFKLSVSVPGTNPPRIDNHDLPRGRI